MYGGKVEPNVMASVSIGRMGWVEIAGTNGEFSIPIPKQKEGTIIEVIAIDRVGNRSEAVNVEVYDNGAILDDIIPPKLESIELSPREVNLGETVTVKVKATDDKSGVTKAAIFYKTENPSSIGYLKLNYDVEQKLWVGSFKVEENYQNGDWIITQVDLIDNANNYGNTKPNEYPNNSIWNFKIHNENGDWNPPKLESIEASPSTAKAGDTVTITAKVTDDKSGVQRVNIWYQTPSYSANKKVKNYTLSYDSELEAWVGNYTIDEFVEAGTWVLDMVKITDKAGNFTQLLEDNLIEFENGNFIVESNENKDTTAPEAPYVDEVTENSKGLTGRAEIGSTVIVKAGENKLGSAVVQEDGTYTIEIEPQEAGTILSVTATDKAGNVSEVTSVTVVDKTSPENYQIWEPKESVPVDKVWTIKFNQELDKRFINGNFFIKDTNGNFVSVNTILKDNKTITVKPLTQYLKGETYTLYITEDVRSKNNIPLKESVVMKFTIEGES